MHCYVRLGKICEGLPHGVPAVGSVSKVVSGGSDRRCGYRDPDQVRIPDASGAGKAKMGSGPMQMPCYSKTVAGR